MESVLKREVVYNKTLCRFLGVCSFIILTGLGAYVRIPLPFTPVPLTLQTFFVLLGAAFLGTRLGVITQLSYIILGVLGLPVFSGYGRGLWYLFGPTGGYLFGFILASLFVGRLIKYHQNNLFLTFAILYLGDLVLLGCGLIWLKALFGYSLAKLFIIGLLPFAVGDAFKALFAATLYLKFKSRLQEIF